MIEPIFLTLDEVLEIHRHQIDTYGGSSGIRDLPLLESAIAQPASQFDGNYLHKDIFQMAAASYLYHLVQNHPFIDGNKRVGAACAHAFLYINGVVLKAECEDAFEKMVLAVAQGRAKKNDIAKFFRLNINDAKK